jgi:hypothetical protein
MNLPKNIIFHTFRGINGLSGTNSNKLDVAGIKDIKYYKRLFCIFDGDHPYTLRITYNLDNSKTTITENSIGLLVGLYFLLGSGNSDTDTIITRRYQSIRDCQYEMDEIKTKQNKLKKINDDLILKIQEEFKKEY